MNIENLIEEARKQQDHSYSPYSNFKVGAALLTESGKIYTGTNVENSSYGLTVCAERIAIFKAISEGEKVFKKLVIVSSGKDYVFPCGACLQVIAEFTKNLNIIVTDENNNYKEYNVLDMLPKAFSLQ